MGNREWRKKIYEELFSAKALCVCALLIMPALLFAPRVEARVFLFFFFWIISHCCGKKNNFFITFFVIIFIVAFNLIVPQGRVLFSLGAFRITGGALSLGIQRAFTLSALMMLSRVCIRSDLKIPGLAGELLGESLRLFSIIMNRRRRITRKNLIGDIDQMMIELSSDESRDSSPDGEQTAPQEVRTKPAGFVILALVVIFSWSSWLVG
jgi:heptaprenyl diphosphate synthase